MNAAAGSSADRELAATIHAAHPGWRAWRTSDGGLAARKGGTPPPGAHVRGSSLAELTSAIEIAITHGLPQVLRRPEQAALGVLEAASGPLTARAVSDAADLHLSTTATALAVLRDRDLVTRHRDGRTWLYTSASQTGSNPLHEESGQPT